MTTNGLTTRRVAGGLLLATGLVWMAENVTDVDLPWRWILPALLIAWGISLVTGRGGGGPGAPPSQFERDDAPRVP